MNKLKNVDEISIEWNDDNCVIICKTLKALGYTLYRKYSSKPGWNYIVGSCGEFCGGECKNKYHFTSLENFLKYHFSEEKSELEIEFEELQKQIKELNEKADKIKPLINKTN